MKNVSNIKELRGSINHADVQAGLDYWCGLRGERKFPCRSDMDPLHIPHLLPTVSLVDVLTDPDDFRFRLIGAQPAKSHSSQIGQSAFDIPEEEGRDRILARYQRCVAERRPVLDLYRCIKEGQDLHDVEVITCPLSDNGEIVNMLVNFGLSQPVLGSSS